MKQKWKYRETLLPREIELMMAILLRNPDVFAVFKEKLSADHFDDKYYPYAVIWQAVLNYYQDYSCLPNKKMLLSAIARMGDEDPQLLQEDERQEVDRFIDQAFAAREAEEDDRKSKVEAEWAIKTIKRFCEEQIVEDLQQSVQGRGGILQNLPEFLARKCQELSENAAIDHPHVSVFFKPDWDAKAGLEIFPTNLPFFDSYLNGGHAPGEVNGLLGPFGSCKTTLGVMLAVEGVQSTVRIRASADPEYEGYSFFVSYEAPIMPELMHRTLSYSAQIQQESLQTMEGIESLSTSKDLRPYEKKLFPDWHKVKVLGEQGRAKIMIPRLEEWMIPIDLTGQDLHRQGQGGGYIDEIVELIERELRKRGPRAKVNLVVIDYVGAMCRRHVAARGRKFWKSLPFLIAEAPAKAKREIACRFDCPVWLIHQLSGEANKKHPGSHYDHTDAAGSQSFAENLDFCFILGKPTKANLCQLICSKHRRTGPRPPEILRIRGDLSRVEGTSGEYLLDPHSRSILEQSLLNSVQQLS